MLLVPQQACFAVSKQTFPAAVRPLIGNIFLELWCILILNQCHIIHKVLATLQQTQRSKAQVMDTSLGIPRALFYLFVVWPRFSQTTSAFVYMRPGQECLPSRGGSSLHVEKFFVQCLRITRHLQKLQFANLEFKTSCRRSNYVVLIAGGSSVRYFFCTLAIFWVT